MSDLSDRKEREDRRSRRATDAPRSWRGSGLVIVIEDEDGIRRYARRILENHGFTVEAAADGREGLALFERHRNEAALVLLDRAMPSLSGEQVLAEIHRLRPDMPVVIASGYAEAASSHPTRSTVAGYLAKPFRPEELIVVVREALTWTPR